MEPLSNGAPSAPSPDPTRERLDSWKDIASFFGRDISTAQRWEKREGMPVHRHVHSQRGSVYAFRDELEAWWQTRRAQLEVDAAPGREAPAGWTVDRWLHNQYAWAAFGLLAGAGVALLIASAVAARRPADVGATTVRFQLPAPPDTTYDDVPANPKPAVSPDGRYIAAMGLGADRVRRLWIHALDSERPREVAGTEGADSPFWSPDGRFIGFAAHGRLMRVPATGGAAETIAPLPGSHDEGDAGSIAGGAWTNQGVILFGDTSTGGLYRASPSGGPVTPVTSLDLSHGEVAHRFPSVLPDGRHFVFLVWGNQPDSTGVYVGSLDSPERKRLWPFDTSVAFVPPGYLLFVRGITLMAQRVDAARLELEGEPVPLGEGILAAPTFREAPFAAGGDTLVYRAGGHPEARLLLFDRSGQQLSTLDGPGRYPANPAISPDGKRLAIARVDAVEGSSDIWLVDNGRGIASRFTTHPGWELAPLWSKDGRRIVFASNRNGPWDLYERDVEVGESGTASRDRLLIQSAHNKHPQTWSADGADLIYADDDPVTDGDLWMLTASGHQGPRPLVRSEFNEREAQLSPDGRWLAYVSDESGRSEVYVRRFPSGTDKQRISPGGGAEPRWRDNGSELFYVDGDRRLRAVAMGSSPFAAHSAPVILFDLKLTDSFLWDYGVVPGGQQFVIKQATSEARTSALNVVLNWPALLPPARR